MYIGPGLARDWCTVQGGDDGGTVALRVAMVWFVRGLVPADD